MLFELFPHDPESPKFNVVLRGHDRQRVDALVRRGWATLHALLEGRTAPDTVTADELRHHQLPLVLRGYDRFQVHSYLSSLASMIHDLSCPAEADPPPVEFDVALRGYDRQQINTLVARGQKTLRALLEGRTAPDTVTADELRHHQLPLVLRGYDPFQVDSYLDMLGQGLSAARPRH